MHALSSGAHGEDAADDLRFARFDPIGYLLPVRAVAVKMPAVKDGNAALDLGAAAALRALKELLALDVGGVSLVGGCIRITGHKY